MWVACDYSRCTVPAACLIEDHKDGVSNSPIPTPPPFPTNMHTCRNRYSTCLQSTKMWDRNPGLKSSYKLQTQISNRTRLAGVFAEMQKNSYWDNVQDASLGLSQDSSLWKVLYKSLLFKVGPSRRMLREQHSVARIQGLAEENPIRIILWRSPNDCVRNLVFILQVGEPL